MLGGALLAVYALPDLFFPIAFRLSGGASRMYGLLLLPPLCCLAVGNVALWASADGASAGERAALLGSLLSTGVAAVGVGLYFGLSITTVAGVVDAAFLVVLGGFVGMLGSAGLLGAVRIRTRDRRSVGAVLLLVAPVVTVVALAVLLVTRLPIRFAAVTVPYGVAWSVVCYQLFDDRRRNTGEGRPVPWPDRP